MNRFIILPTPEGKRPRVHIKLKNSDKAIEAAGIACLLGIWAFVIFNYADLPEVIPVHFNMSGEADGFGGKSAVFGLPVFATVIFIGLTILGKYPHNFNYTVKITAENACRQYLLATRMMRVLKLNIVAISGIIAVQTISLANGNDDTIGVWLTPVVLLLIMGPVVFFLIKMSKN